MTYAVEVSADKATWNSGSGYATVVSDTGTGATRVIITRDNTPTTIAAPRYIRLTVTQGANSQTIGESPSPVSAVSRGLHGGAGTFDLTLALTGAASVEPRNLGGSLTLVFTFDRAIIASTPSLTVGTGTVGGVVFSGTTATVSLTGVANAQTITVRLDGLNGSGNAAQVSVGVLAGDVNGDGVVTTADVNVVRAQSGQAAGAGNFTKDVNLSGVISTSDVNVVRSFTGTFLP